MDADYLAAYVNMASVPIKVSMKLWQNILLAKWEGLILTSLVEYDQTKSNIICADF